LISRLDGAKTLSMNCGLGVVGVDILKTHFEMHKKRFDLIRQPTSAAKTENLMHFF
jgi:hypothetical protein